MAGPVGALSFAGGGCSSEIMSKEDNVWFLGQDVDKLTPDVYFLSSLKTPMLCMKVWKAQASSRSLPEIRTSFLASEIVSRRQT